VPHADYRLKSLVLDQGMIKAIIDNLLQVLDKNDE
jgi:hypothetical protein